MKKPMSGFLLCLLMVISFGCLISNPFPNVPECVWLSVSPPSGVCIDTISAAQTTVDDTGNNNYSYQGKEYTWSQLALMSILVPPDSEAAIKTWSQAECHQAGNCGNIGSWAIVEPQIHENQQYIDRDPHIHLPDIRLRWDLP
jgi:hypothetical protein